MCKIKVSYPLTDRLSGVDSGFHVALALVLAFGLFLVLLDVVQLGHGDLLVCLVIVPVRKGKKVVRYTNAIEWLVDARETNGSRWRVLAGCQGRQMG